MTACGFDGSGGLQVSYGIEIGDRWSHITNTSTITNTNTMYMNDIEDTGEPMFMNWSPISSRLNVGTIELMQTMQTTTNPQFSPIKKQGPLEFSIAQANTQVPPKTSAWDEFLRNC